MGLSIYTNQGAVVGRFLRKLLFGIMGISSYSIPLIILGLGVAILQKNITYVHKYKYLVLLLYLNFLFIVMNIFIAIQKILLNIGIMVIKKF